MSYSNSLGSVFVPTSTIIPFASINSYTQAAPPSGYVYCDGYYYDPSDPSYSNLFSLIDYDYGQVVITVGTTPTTYFRVPNLMGQSSDVTDVSGFYETPYKLGSFTIIGGINSSGNGNVNTTNTITLTTNQLPPHTHDLPGQTAAITASDTGHTHTLNAGTITVTCSGGDHTHGIDDSPTHNHGLGNTSMKIDNIVDINTGNGLTQPCLTYENETGTQGYTAVVEKGNAFEFASPGISAAKSTANLKSTTTINTEFTNDLGYAQYSGYAAVQAGNTQGTYVTGTNNTSVTNNTVTIPPTPSFVTNYLIKL
jgi:microcystin-dependent protein